MPLVKRRFFIQCIEDECFKLYELVKDRIPSVAYVSMEITAKGLMIEAYGHESDVKEIWQEIKRIIGPLKEATRRGGLRKYSMSLLNKMIRKTLPPRLLVEVLKRRGYDARYIDEEDTVATNADLDVVKEIAERIADLNMDAGRYASNTSTRYFIVAVSAITNSSLEEVVGRGKELGLLEQVDDSRYSLTMDWRHAIEMFLKHIGIK